MLPSYPVSSRHRIDSITRKESLSSSPHSDVDVSWAMPSFSLPTAEEQGLCLGVGLFTISATNGVDVTRRFNVIGFCQSVDAVAESVQSTVMSRGGEIWDVKREVR